MGGDIEVFKTGRLVIRIGLRVGGRRGARYVAAPRHLKTVQVGDKRIVVGDLQKQAVKAGGVFDGHPGVIGKIGHGRRRFG